MTTAEASFIVDGWMEAPNVALLSPTEQHWAILSDLLPKSQARGPLIMDAHLAALAIEHGATLCTNDRDFLRFPGLKVEFPLQ
jgi:predicted nucleic acid-binding protein